MVEKSGAAVALCRQLRETPHDSLPQLYDKMIDTADALPDVGLQSVVPFAEAYSELTWLADAGLQEGIFADAPTTERLATNFAGLYFDAIATHLAGEHHAVPASWQQLFRADCNQPPWLHLALGVNAHIGHDLPLALQKTAVRPEFGESFFGINLAIRSIATVLAPVLLPRVPDRPRTRVAMIAANVIIGWRRQAWDSFIQLEAGQKSLNQIERAAAQRGRLLQRVNVGLGALGITGV